MDFHVFPYGFEDMLRMYGAGAAGAEIVAPGAGAGAVPN